MGAESFNIRAVGYTAAEAFDAAREHAQWDYGHSGYTGTIAEKDAFVMVPVPATMPTITDEHIRDKCLSNRRDLNLPRLSLVGHWIEEKLDPHPPRPMTIYEYADHLNDDNESPVNDKWGPAGCFQLSKNEWLFFGWASS